MTSHLGQLSFCCVVPCRWTHNTRVRRARTETDDFKFCVWQSALEQIHAYLECQWAYLACTPEIRWILTDWLQRYRNCETPIIMMSRSRPNSYRWRRSEFRVWLGWIRPLTSAALPNSHRNRLEKFFSNSQSEIGKLRFPINWPVEHLKTDSTTDYEDFAFTIGSDWKTLILDQLTHLTSLILTTQMRGRRGDK